MHAFFSCCDPVVPLVLPPLFPTTSSHAPRCSLTLKPPVSSSAPRSVQDYTRSASHSSSCLYQNWPCGSIQTRCCIGRVTVLMSCRSSHDSGHALRRVSRSRSHKLIVTPCFLTVARCLAAGLHATLAATLSVLFLSLSDLLRSALNVRAVHAVRPTCA